MSAIPENQNGPASSHPRRTDETTTYQEEVPMSQDTRTPSRFGAAVARALSLALYAAGLDLAHLAGLMVMPVEDLRSLLAGERPMMVGDLIAACHAIGVRAGNVIADAERMAAEPLPGDRVRIVEAETSSNLDEVSGPACVEVAL